MANVKYSEDGKVLIEAHDINGYFVVPEEVIKIGECAFLECSSLTSIEIPNSVTKIGRCAFQNCSSLTSIEIPNSVTVIEDSAFRECSSMTKIVIPNSVTKIEDRAFMYCSSLSSIEIPNLFTDIGVGVFSGCSSLLEMHLRVEDPTSIQFNLSFGYLASCSLCTYRCAQGLHSIDTTFACFDRSQCTLYVPVGTGYAYRHHPEFGKFKEVIIER